MKEEKFMPTEKEIVALKKRLQGITSANQDVLNLEPVKRSIELIENIALPDSVSLTSKAINPKRIIKTAKKDFTRIFPNVNRQVLYADEEDIYFIDNQNAQHPYANKLLIQKLNDISKPVDVFEISLLYEQTQERFGANCSPMLLKDDIYYLNNTPILASWIQITDPSDYMSTIIYEHELTHLLQLRYRGIIEDYFQEEVLPITIEKIMALECDETETLLEKMQLFRMNSQQISSKGIKTNEDETKEHHQTYLISGLIANCIFDRYYNESPTGRNYILGEIQDVLNGKKTLGQLLQEQTISLDTSEAVTATKHSIQKCLKK